MHFSEEFFLNECREGFEISALMKRCWAAQLEVLEQFDGICKRHGLHYYAAYGTLLGAVRHGGFIPWDDDIDIWMLRTDLDRLISECQESISSEGLQIVTPFSNAEYRNMVVRINNTRVFSLDEPFLMKYHLFPFTAGIDIFPLDSLPDDFAEMEDMRKKLSYAVSLENKWHNGSEPLENLMEQYMQLVKELGVSPADENDVGCHIWWIIDHICGMYAEKKTKNVAMLTYYYDDNAKLYDREWFGNPIYLDFEGFSMPCPKESRAVLNTEFGKDYMTPVRTGGDHDYPYYRSRQELLKKFLQKNGIPCPGIYENP